VRVAAAALALAPSQACSQGRPPENIVGHQRFVVGPPPDVGSGRGDRFLLDIPRAYIPSRLRRSADTPIAGTAVPFVARIADLSAAGEGSANLPGVFSGTIGWAPADFVQRRVDGTWLNSFSQYSQPLGNRFGLEVRTTREAQYLPAELYVLLSDSQNLMIECAYLPADRPQYCQMWSQKPGAPLVELWFREDDLPRWRAMADGAHRLVDTWSVKEEGARR